MSREEFEQLVREAVKELPQEFLERLDNVDIVVEEWPSGSQMMAAGLHPQSLLFGLYQGTPPTKRTSASIFPDKITVFAGPILMTTIPERIKEVVVRVVKHEIAHHFGMDEQRVRNTGH